ncbi:MAG: sugar ABC transporter substrate-binding protein [Clostridiales bacterium]|nr:sugar ABC transporter substrate-binding protein [Clostridiales bacterium]
MKKLLAILLLTVMLATLVPTAFAAETPTLNVWIKKTFSADLNDAWQNAAIEYGKSKGWNVEVTIIATADQVQIFTAALESNSMPDVFYVSETLIPMIAAKGVFMDLTEVADKRTQEGSFVSPRALELGTVDGAAVSIPLYHENRVLFYRKSMLEAAGYTEPPKTFNELCEMAVKISQATPEGVYGFGEPLNGVPDCDINTLVQVWQNGGSLWSKDNEVACTDPKVAEIVQKYVDLVNNGGMPSNVVSWSDTDNNTAFMSGQCAMVINSPTLLNSLKGEGYEKILADTGYTWVPSADDGTRRLYGAAHFICANQNSKFPAEAKEMADYLTSPEFVTEWLGENAAPILCPALVSVSQNEIWSRPENKILADASAFHCFCGYPGDFTDYATDVYNQKLFGNMYAKVLVGGMTVEEALAELADEMQDVKDSY